MLLALLKRRKATAEALVKAKVQAQELKAELAPLKEEIQKLKLQRACLEEKVNLIHIHWMEDVRHYKVNWKHGNTLTCAFSNVGSFTIHCLRCFSTGNSRFFGREQQRSENRGKLSKEENWRN